MDRRIAGLSLLLGALGALGALVPQPALAAPGDDAEPSGSMPPPAPPPPPVAPLAVDAATVVPHRFELGARIGMLSGGEVRPRGAPQADLGDSLVLFADFNHVINPYFMVGVYASYQIGDADPADAPTLTSAGATLKTRIPLNPKADLRFGLHMGRNAILVSGMDASGSGVNMAPSFELSYKVTPTFALSGQLSFVSQVSGSVTLDGEESKFTSVRATPRSPSTIRRAWVTSPTRTSPCRIRWITTSRDRSCSAESSNMRARRASPTRRPSSERPRW